MDEQQIFDLIARVDAGDEAAAEMLVAMSAEVLAEFAYGRD